MADSPRSIGSLLDLLPRPNTPEWLALPPHVLAEVKLLRKGHRPLSQGAIDEHELLPKRIEHLQHEVKALESKLEDVRVSVIELSDRLVSPVELMLAEFRALGTRLTLLEADRAKHDARLDQQDLNQAVHRDQIASVSKRLGAVEQVISKRPKRKTRKKAK